MSRRKKGLQFYQKERKLSPKHIQEIFEMIVGTLIVIFIAAAITYFVGMRTSVVGDSMEPSLYSGQEILINRFIYNFSSPKRGDVIVFLPNGNQKTHYYVKRVVGLPGETVQIINGRVYVDGVLLDEGDDFDKIVNPGIAENGMTLAVDEYFVLGDSRNDGEDSRSGNIGAVKKNNIIGQAWFRFSHGESEMGFVE